MSQITIRDIPTPVENELRRLASEKRISLSRMAVILIQNALGFSPAKKRDVSCVYGKWSSEDADEFQRNTASTREIDEEIWK